jgi:hypothetical protein
VIDWADKALVSNSLFKHNRKARSRTYKPIALPRVAGARLGPETPSISAKPFDAVICDGDDRRRLTVHWNADIGNGADVVFMGRLLRPR